MNPLELGSIEVIIIAHSLFRQFDFGSSSPNRVEILHILFVILPSSEASSNSPHSGEDEEGFIDDFLLLFNLAFDDVFVLN